MWDKIGKSIKDYYSRSDKDNSESENNSTGDIVQGAISMFAPNPTNPIGSAMGGTGQLVKGIIGAASE